MNKAKALFLTGITGTLGKEMLRALLTTTDHRLYLLVRRKSGRYSHWDRVRAILEPWGLTRFLGTRVHVFEGDVTLPGLGLQTADFEELRKSVEEVYHIAALTTLNAGEEECRKINVGGTEEALKLAVALRKIGKLRRFFYFSTAYAAGSRQTYLSKENALPENPVFANHYESSKFASETRVRQAMADGLPVTIFRPSIVVGDSQTGEVSEFNVIYPFMKLFAHGILRLLPSRPNNAVNVVPIDFVIRASLAIANHPGSIGHAFHLVTKEPPTIKMLLDLRHDFQEAPEVTIISPDDFTKERLSPNDRMVYEMLEPYLGYLNDGLTFDTTNTERLLEGTGISFPKTDMDFLRTLVRYAVDAGYLLVK